MALLHLLPAICEEMGNVSRSTQAKATSIRASAIDKHVCTEFNIKIRRAHPRFMPHQVKLVVIDSVAFHFRQDFRDMALRTRLLKGMAQQLLRLAAENELAVVLVNQMTTRIGRGSEEAHLIPALGERFLICTSSFWLNFLTYSFYVGESWGHACTIRIILSWQGSQRCATLYKSPSAPESTVKYSVTVRGPQRTEAQESKHAIKEFQHPHLPLAMAGGWYPRCGGRI